MVNDKIEYLMDNYVDNDGGGYNTGKGGEFEQGSEEGEIAGCRGDYRYKVIKYNSHIDWIIECNGRGWGSCYGYGYKDGKKIKW